MSARVAVAGLVLVLLAGAARAATFKVGPGGTHETIQAAIDAARDGGDPDNEIRVAAGRWPERLRVDDWLVVGGSLRISGGWLDDFSRRLTDPGATVVDGGGLAPVVRLSVSRGHFVMTGFTIRAGDRPAKGEADRVGGGVSLRVGAGGVVELVGNHVRENRLMDEDGRADGGGLQAFATGDGRLVLRDNEFTDNSVAAPSDRDVAGGGAYVVASQRARVVVATNRFLRNEAHAPSYWASSSALHVDVSGSAEADVSDNAVAENRTLSSSGRGALGLFVSGVGATDGTFARIVARRNRVWGNVVSTGTLPTSAVELRATSSGHLDFSDSLVFRNDSAGVAASASTSGRLELVNLTVANHQGPGVWAGASDGKLLLANTILFGNAEDLFVATGDVVQVSNLIGVDPLFIDAGSADYRLHVRSPAVDAGTGPPRVELGPSDVAGAPRVRGPAVDIGAHELPPGCRVLWPGSDPSTVACRCLSDGGLRQFRCGFFLPDVFLSLRMPLPPWSPGEPVQADWTIHPWTDVAGPYSMAASALVGEDWVPQEWLGPTAPALKEGELVVEPFTLKLPAEGATPLQTTLKYRRRDAKDALRATVEVTLPEAGPGK